MSIAAGIDLGTYQCAIAVYLNEEITVIPQENGKDFMPSAVSFTHEDVLIGYSAKEQYITNPENTIFGVKRIIGKDFDDPQLQKYIDCVPFNVENVNGNPKISVICKGNKKLYDPESISAMILKKLKMKAEIILGLKIIDAVITVPSFFNDSQRQATKDAASLAGLNVLQILNEPTAAAIAYGLHKYSADEKYVLIYDFGCGMFSVSILKIKNGNKFETRSTAGDTNLGGFEVAEALVDFCADLFYKKHKKCIKSKSNIRAVRRLRVACSQAMNILSSKEETVIAVNSLIDEIDFSVNISRAKFEDLCEDIFNETIELLHQVLKDSGINKKHINDVVLIGGITKIPKVRHLISNYFDGIRLNHSFNSSLAVIYGAAIQASFLSGYKDKKIKNLLCVDVTPISVGIEVLNGIMTIIIEKGTPIPVNASYTITTHVDNQSGVAIRVFEGERAFTCHNHLLGTLELLELPPFPRGIPQVEVTFEIDSNGILTVSAKEKTGMNFDTMSVKLNKNRLTKEEIDHLRKEADEFEEKDNIERDRIQHQNALEKYVRRIYDAASTNAGGRISSKDQLEIYKICNEINDWFESNPHADVQSIIEKRNAAIKLLQPYASRLDVSIIERRDRDVELAKGSSSDKQSLQVDKYKF